MVYLDAAESAGMCTMLVLAMSVCRLVSASEPRSALTTSGTVATQDSEHEATDKSLELRAQNRSAGSFEVDLSYTAPDLCTNTKHFQQRITALAIYSPSQTSHDLKPNSRVSLFCAM